MTDQKRYLDVPYAQKDQAKALGARWDAARKKWYIPKGIESAPFAQWKPEATGGDDNLPDEPRSGNGKASLASRPSKPKADAQGPITIAHTRPSDPNFVPYCGEDPPWE